MSRSFCGLGGVFVVPLALSMSAGCSEGAPPRAIRTTHSTDVEEAFEEYRSAMMAFDGERAAETVSKSTWALYQQWRDAALVAGEQQVKQLPALDMYNVLLFRHVLGTQLLDMDGRAMFAWAVDIKQLGSKDIPLMSVREIRKESDTAVATLNVTGKGDSTAKFVKEQGRWRYDIGAMIDVPRAIVAQAARSSGKANDAFVVAKVATSVPGRKVDDAI